MRNFIKLSLLTVIGIGASSLALMAQKEVEPITAKNAVYLELGGNGIVYSLNYERLAYQRGLFRAGGRIGVGVIPWTISSNTYVAALLPVEFVGLVGRTKHFLELGVGYTPALVPKRKTNSTTAETEFERYRMSSAIPFRLGYRYQKPGGGLLFRVAYMPILDFTPERRTPLVPMFGGISIGKSF